MQIFLDNFIIKYIEFYSLNYSKIHNSPLLFSKLKTHTKNIPDFYFFSLKLACSLILIGYYFILFISFKKINYFMYFKFLINFNLTITNNLFKFFENLINIIDIDKSKVKDTRISKSNFNLNLDNKLIYDFIIVGSGPGGSIIANKLHKQQKNFLILDSGSLSSTNAYSYEEILNKYMNSGITVTYGNSLISLAQAECVGGGSEINSGLFHKIPKSILDEWESNFNLKIDNDNISKQTYNKIIKDLSIQNYKYETHIPEQAKILLKGKSKYKYISTQIPRWFKYDKVTKKYIKQSMTKTYLHKDILKNHLSEKTKAVKLFYKKNCWNIECTKNNKSIILKTKKLILSAGAINTPYILKNSNIKKNIGNTLQCHPTIKVTAFFNKKINNNNYEVANIQTRLNNNNKICFGSSISTIPYLKVAMNYYPNYNKFVDENYQKMAIYYVSIKPKGYGSIHKLPFFKDPFIYYNLTEEDKVQLAFGLKELTNLLLESGAKQIFPSIKSSKIIENKKDLMKMPNNINPKLSNLFSVHLFGSCPMGENQSKCAVDSKGKIFDFNNIYVCDSSILPTATNVNPQGPLMFLAHKISEEIIK